MIRPELGLVVDGFTLGDCLHKGGFATIWDVRHPAHDLPMVMKVPVILDGFDGPNIVGFETEQMIMPRLSGPHVPQVVALGDFARLPYIVMEKIAGESALDLSRRAPLPVAEAVDLVARMAEAVHDLHRQQVVHLDLKPANFLRRASGDMVCIDFGLSHHARLPDLLAEEFTVPMGTFPYIAPEQYLGQRADLRSDVFALGAILYELVTGRMPFGDPVGLRGVRRRLWRDPEPPRAFDRQIPEWLQEVILQALEVDPADRTQSAAQVLFDLRHPEQVRLTTRGHKVARDGFWPVLSRRIARRGLKRFAAPPAMAEQIEAAPVLLVAVDLAPDLEPLARALLRAVKRMLMIRPEARVACINVIRVARLGIDATTTDAGENLHVARLVQLRAWAEGLDLPQDRLTFSILEGVDPGQVILDHAAKTGVEHILMGARSHSVARRYLGSVSSQVVAEAGCSVTVIRLPERGEGQGGQPP